MKKLLLAVLIFFGAFQASADDIWGNVVGIGADSWYPEDLYARGYDAALFEIRVCSITGRMSNHSRCFLIFDTGYSEYVDALNRKLIPAFYEKIKRLACEYPRGEEGRKDCEGVKQEKIETPVQSPCQGKKCAAKKR